MYKSIFTPPSIQNKIVTIGGHNIWFCTYQGNKALKDVMEIALVLPPANSNANIAIGEWSFSLIDAYEISLLHMEEGMVRWKAVRIEEGKVMYREINNDLVNIADDKVIHVTVDKQIINEWGGEHWVAFVLKKNEYNRLELYSYVENKGLKKHSLPEDITDYRLILNGTVLACLVNDYAHFYRLCLLKGDMGREKICNFETVIGHEGRPESGKYKRPLTDTIFNEEACEIEWDSPLYEIFSIYENCLIKYRLTYTFINIITTPIWKLPDEIKKAGIKKAFVYCEKERRSNTGLKGVGLKKSGINLFITVLCKNGILYRMDVLKWSSLKPIDVKEKYNWHKITDNVRDIGFVRCGEGRSVFALKNNDEVWEYFIDYDAVSELGKVGENVDSLIIPFNYWIKREERLIQNKLQQNYGIKINFGTNKKAYAIGYLCLDKNGLFKIVLSNYSASFADIEEGRFIGNFYTNEYMLTSSLLNPSYLLETI